VHDLHMVQSVLALPDHLACRARYREPLDFSYAGPQSRKPCRTRRCERGQDRRDPHHLELYARMLVDLTPQSHCRRRKADRAGNL